MTVLDGIGDHWYDLKMKVKTFTNENCLLLRREINQRVQSEGCINRAIQALQRSPRLARSAPIWLVKLALKKSDKSHSHELQTRPS